MVSKGRKTTGVWKGKKRKKTKKKKGMEGVCTAGGKRKTGE